MEQDDLLRDLVLRLAEVGEWDEIATILAGQHPADIADVIHYAPAEQRRRLFSLVEKDLKPDVLAELAAVGESELLEALTNAEISDLVEEMSPDDAADVLADLSLERSEKVLGLMEEEESEEVRALLKYDEESAGGIMTPDLLAFRSDQTVAQALDQIAHSELDEPIYNAYVVDSDNRLIGVIRLWELLKVRDRNQSLSEVCDTEVVSVTTDTDQEEVAHTMAKYDLTAIPTVDENGVLVGRITVDDVMDVMQEEASEDIFRLAGSDDAELTYTSPLQACRARLPWLLVTLGITFLGSLILKRFMLDLSEVLALSFFVPIVMAMCGSTGMQSSTLIIRGLALHTLEGDGLWNILSREIVAGIVLGLICGLLMGGWAQFVIAISPEHRAAYAPLFLAFTAGSALVAAMTFAAVYGAMVPIVLNRLKIDPAVASGPFVTASNDIVALLIYYGTTMGLLHLYRLYFPGLS